jgi:nardilysin
MWWLQDRHYHRPIADLRLQIVSAAANKTPLHRVCAEMVRLLCVDALVEDSYMADVCDLSYSLDATDVGFTVTVDGFDHKLLDLFERVMSVFLSFAGQTSSLPTGITEERFSSCVEVLQRKYKNADMKASSLCTSIRLQAFRPTLWSVHQKSLALETLDIPLFARMASKLLEEFAVEALYHGNVGRADAENAKELILTMVRKHVSSGRDIGLPRKRYPAQSVLRLPLVNEIPIITVPSKDPAEPNTAVELYIQIGKDNLRDRVMADLLVHLMEEQFFDQVRTKDQFGYDCYCDVRWSYGIIGLVFHVVTNVKSGAAVLERVDRFLVDCRLQLETSDDFLEYLVGFATQKLDMFNSLNEETNSYWQEIRDGRFDWQSWRSEAVCLKSLTKQDVIESFHRWLAPSTRRNILAVQVIGSGQGDSSLGRPSVDSDNFESFVDEQVADLHRRCKKQFWGRVNSKLF